MKVGNNTVVWAKVKPDAIIPTKREEDAGYDIYSCFEESFRVINPNKIALIPTGIASAFSSDWYAQIEERGSTGTKSIAKRCGVFDSGFRNEWMIVLTNHNKYEVVIYKNEEDKNQLINMFGINTILYPYSKAIAQAVILPVPKLNHIEMTYQELLMIKSERGTGMLGSSLK